MHERIEMVLCHDELNIQYSTMLGLPPIPASKFTAIISLTWSILQSLCTLLGYMCLYNKSISF